MTKAVNWNELSYHELRSCAMKRRFKTEPPLPNMTFRTYHCNICGGWHLATKKQFKRERPAPQGRRP